MQGREPQIRATILEGLDNLLKTYPGLNIGLAQLLDEVGVQMAVDVPLQELPLNAFARLLELAATRTGDACFGLHFAAAYPVGGMGMIGYVINNAPDLQTMLECLSRYARLQIDAFDLEFKTAGSTVEICWRFGPSLHQPKKQLTEFLMALFVNRARLLVGEDWRPASVDFDYREPSCGGEYEIQFGRRLKFDTSIGRISMSKGSLKRLSKKSDSKLFEILRSIVEKEVQSLKSQGDVVECARAYIVEKLEVNHVDLEHAAAAVKLTPRQLQSEFKRRGTTFVDELSGIRKRMALRYLQDTDLPMTEIAMMLGFSELSAFTRAARIWFGKAPSEQRAALRSGAPGQTASGA